jgi:GDP-4-dehydro-6-deoxy-D-mannose reductase
MRVLITGIAGFVGSHLTEWLLARGHTVFGTVLPGESLANLDPGSEQMTLLPCDITRREQVAQAVGACEPEQIYHLAAQASVGESFARPDLTMDVNVKGTVNLLEAARAQPVPPRTVVVTSAEVYGDLSEADLPAKETTRFAPAHPYAASKVAVHFLGQVYWRTYGVPVLEARPFNHIGPRQRPGFVVPDFARQVAAIRLGQQAPVMHVGNLSPRRDFTDVRDVVRAYQVLADLGEAGAVYHICSEHAVGVSQVLEMLLDLCDCSVRVETDAYRLRPAKMPVLFGSAERLRALGWAPSIPLAQSLRDTLAYWEQALHVEGAGSTAA